MQFTGVIQFRNAIDLGALYWTVNLFIALVTSFASTWVFFKVGSDDSRVVAVNEAATWSVLGLLAGSWLLSFALFQMLIKKEYRGTFFSTETGREAICRRFLAAMTDEGRSDIMNDNKAIWVDIREKVKDWVQEGWWSWREEKPEWFSNAWIHKVPVAMIPKEELRVVSEEVNQSRKRKSGRKSKGTRAAAVEPVS